MEDLPPSLPSSLRATLKPSESFQLVECAKVRGRWVQMHHFTGRVVTSCGGGSLGLWVTAWRVEIQGKSDPHWALQEQHISISDVTPLGFWDLFITATELVLPWIRQIEAALVGRGWLAYARSHHRETTGPGCEIKLVSCPLRQHVSWVMLAGAWSVRCYGFTQEGNLFSFQDSEKSKGSPVNRATYINRWLPRLCVQGPLGERCSGNFSFQFCDFWCQLCLCLS